MFKKTFAFVLGAALLIGVAHAQVRVDIGNTADRVRALETPYTTLLASNATTAQIDFRAGPFTFTNNAGGPSIGTEFYAVNQLNGNITLQLTNLTPGVIRQVLIQTDGSARTVTVSTNGITTSTSIMYSFGSITNGSSQFTVTNRTMISFTPLSFGLVRAIITPFR